MCASSCRAHAAQVFHRHATIADIDQSLPQASFFTLLGVLRLPQGLLYVQFEARFRQGLCVPRIRSFFAIFVTPYGNTVQPLQFFNSDSLDI